MKSLELKKNAVVKGPSKKQASNADLLAQILAVPFDEKFAAEMRALRAAAIAGGIKTLNDEQLRGYIHCHDDGQEA